MKMMANIFALTPIGFRSQNLQPIAEMHTRTGEPAGFVPLPRQARGSALVNYTAQDGLNVVKIAQLFVHLRSFCASAGCSCKAESMGRDSSRPIPSGRGTLGRLSWLEGFDELLRRFKERAGS
jgi:hypothetical protein